LEEVKHAEPMQKIESLLNEADQLKKSLVGERRDLSPAGKRARLGADLNQKRPARQDGGGMSAILEGVAHNIRSSRDFVREQSWFEDIRKLVGVGLWETLSFLQLYRLRDSAMENLGLVTATGRHGGKEKKPDTATRRHGDRAGGHDRASVSSAGLTLLVL
jgi:hypothetical protein